MIIFKDKKSDELKNHVHKIKELACEVLTCFEEAAKDHEAEEEYYHEHARRSGRMRTRHYDDYRHDDYYDDDYEDRDMARGRRPVSRGGRY